MIISDFAFELKNYLGKKKNILTIYILQTKDTFRQFCSSVNFRLFF